VKRAAAAEWMASLHSRSRSRARRSGRQIEFKLKTATSGQCHKPPEVSWQVKLLQFPGPLDIESTAKQPVAATDDLSSQRLYHGTRADLKPGDLIEPGSASNYGKKKKASYVYLSATLDAAAWGAELASGEGPGRIYIVEPTGPIMDDPNLTDKKYPGNPTKSYRSREPLRVAGEVTDWHTHSREALKAMKDQIERLRQLGIEAIDD
jgi:hypothetical protein